MRRLPFKSVDIPLTTSRFKKLNLETFKLPSEILERCMTPALILYKDSILRNVRTIIEKHCDSDPKKWRPHLKTTKSSALYNMLIQEGLTQFKVATTREAEIIAKSLRDSGISDGDVLIAYPLQGPNMRRLESIVTEKGAVVDVVNAIRDTGKKFRGLHLYDGHSQSFHDGEERDTKVGDVGEAGTRLMNILNQAGHSVEEIITAGTPSLTSALKFIESVHDDEDNVKRVVSPGTVVLHDLTSESSNAELDLEPACVVLARVVSHPCENIFTVDAGSKAMAAEAGHPMAYCVGNPDMLPLIPSEEHLPIQVPPGTSLPERGTAMYLIPRHVCPTVNLSEHALLMDSKKNVELIEIDAKGHEGPLFMFDV
eukprot:g4818.t1